MKVVGKRFWTWMSVWALSLFVRGEMVAGPQEKPTTQESSSTTSTGHKVTTGTNYIRKTEHKIPTKGTARGVTTDVVTEKMNTQAYKTTSGLKSTSKIAPAADASSKDAAKTTSGKGIMTEALTVKQKGLANDGQGKDPGYITSKVRKHKTHK